jgi:CheY-like chemotaxis protein
LSAKAQDADIERGRKHKVEDYLTKPFDPDRLIEVVERLVG